jgi:hypothetical protein
MSPVSGAPRLIFYAAMSILGAILVISAVLAAQGNRSGVIIGLVAVILYAIALFIGSRKKLI